MILRDYQKECLATIWGALPTEETILIQAATGAGKTIIFCSLVQKLLAKWPNIRTGILAHRRELITQARDKMLSVWPEAHIGLACASTGDKISTDAPITIASIQTMANRAHETAPFQVIIVDEAHRIPPINRKNQYSKWIDTMRQYNPEVRIIGFTATPFRLGHGYIYGSICKPDNKNLFPDLYYRIGIRKLQDAGYLAPFRAKAMADIGEALKSVKTSGGEYQAADLSATMSGLVHIGSAVKAFEEHAKNRKHVLIFAVTIHHAEVLATAFRAAGYKAVCIHSDMPGAQQQLFLKGFDAGHYQIMINVGMLTEGWDSPRIDCIMMCRPTKSPALFVQMTGRGLRTCEGKKDVLILDLANNFREHGHPDEPDIQIPGRSKEPDPIKRSLKECLECGELIPVQVKTCPECGASQHNEKTPIDSRVELQDLSFEPERTVAAIKHAQAYAFTSKKGNYMLRLEMELAEGGEDNIVTFKANHFMDFDGNNQWRYHKTRSLWAQLVGTDPPGSVDEAEERAGELIMSLPDKIGMIKKGKFWNIERWKV